MKNNLKKLAEKWYLVVTGGFFLFAALVFIIFGEKSLIAVHDNLDLFLAQFQMMKNTGTFFRHGVDVPFLGGISRDNLPSEFSLYTILYILLPSYAAYVTGYLLKILVAVFSCVLLAKENCADKYEKVRPLVYLVALAYGVLNVFPAFGIPFASIPLVVYLFQKIDREPKAKWYIALFFYPVLSYFSYFGLFILAYFSLFLLIFWIRDRKFPLRILGAIIVLSAGSMICEYRLFSVMLFGDEVTIRSSMEAGSFSLAESVKMMADGFVNGMFHAESLQKYLVLPVCAIYFLVAAITCFRKKEWKKAFRTPFFLIAVGLLFNSFIYGIYYFEPFRTIVEQLVPQLKGWQFNRTIFFNPFLWYALFFLVLCRMYEKDKLLRYLANVLAVLSVLVIVLSGSRYNDLYRTCLAKTYEIVKGKQSNDLSYEEFYSTELFEQAKEDLHYDHEWSVAYGFHPAILEYNGIDTLDGYLGFYSQEYKEQFRKVIAPALERVEESKEYFDTWGARAYLYSGTDLSIVGAVRDYQVSDTNLYIDTNAFKELGGRYIFSRIELSNAKELGLKLAGTYTNEKSPYTLYVYETASIYVTLEATEKKVSFEEMKNLTYDQELLEDTLSEMQALADQAMAGEKPSSDQEQRMLELYEIVQDQISRLQTCTVIAEICYYQNVNDEENSQRHTELSTDRMNLLNEAYQVLSSVCKSDYDICMKEVLDQNEIELLQDYETLTEEEKQLQLQEEGLIREYEQALLEVNTEDGDDKDANLILGEIYLELVQVRDQIAKLNDYDNYVQYAYDCLYIKDYSVEDAKGLFNEMKNKIQPVLLDISNIYYEENLSKLDQLQGSSAKERLAGVRKHLDDISPEMAECFDEMKQYGLYDMDAAKGKIDMGYTVRLPYYQSAFIFDSPYENYQDYITAVHEFGHYNYMFHENDNPIFSYNNVDLWEMHSQGLEALYYDYAEDLVGKEAGDVFRITDIYQMTESAAEAVMKTEFEYQVYEHPGMSLTDLNKLYYNLGRQYGYVMNENENEDGNWVLVPHFFQAPCYYLGYATSALNSLELFNMARDDREKAVRTYLKLTMLAPGTGYLKAVEETGLHNILEEGEAKKILQNTRDILQDDYQK